MAFLVQTTLRSDSSFAMEKDQKGVPEEAPGLGQVRTMRKMTLDSLRKNSVQKGLGSNAQKNFN